MYPASHDALDDLTAAQMVLASHFKLCTFCRLLFMKSHMHHDWVVCIGAMQVLGNLYPQMERKGQAAVAHFKEAAQKNNSSGEVWEMLGELLASTDPVGVLLLAQIVPATLIRYHRGRLAACALASHQGLIWEPGAGSLAAYKKSLELTRKEKEAEKAAKLKAQQRGRASAGGEMNGHASDSTAAAGNILTHMHTLQCVQALKHA